MSQLRPAALVLLCIALPLQAQEKDHVPNIRVYSDCTALITIDLPSTATVRSAPRHLYESLGERYPVWSDSVRHGRTDDTLYIRTTEALPEDEEGTLLLILREEDGTERTHKIHVPSCQKPLESSEARVLHDVVAGDTLMEIALQYTGDLDVDVNTLMLAIQSFNRRSFMSDNINLLRADRDVVIPSHADILRLNMTPEYVRDEVIRQHTKWRKFKVGEIPHSAIRNRPLRLLPLEIVEKSTSVTAGEPDTTQTVTELSEAPHHEEPTSGIDTQPQNAKQQVSTPDHTDQALTSTKSSDDAGETSSPLDSEAQTKSTSDAIVDASAVASTEEAEDGIHAGWFVVLITAILISGIYLAVLALRRYRRTHLIRSSITTDPSNPDQQISSLLDLARAHIETDNPKLAKPFLEEVLARGSSKEREEAESLRSRIQNND